MPRAPRKCPKAGCETRITSGPYCPEHTTHGWVNGGSTRTTTPEHRAWRTAVLRRDNYTCRIRRPGCSVSASTADHIIPIAEGGAALDLANGQAACVPCHKAKTLDEAARGKRRATTAPF